MKQLKTVYLAGKITGDNKYRSKFAIAADILTQSGYTVLSPATLPPHGFEYDAYMRISEAMLHECAAICFLPDWKESPGALHEFNVAEKSGKEIFYYAEWNENRIKAANKTKFGVAT